MSSYFDEMARRVGLAQERDGLIWAERVVGQVKNRFRNYLDYIDDEVITSQDKTFAEFKSTALRLLEGPNSEPGLGSELVIQEIHSLGHDLGHKFRLRGGRRSSDNPYWPGHQGIEEGQEYVD